MNPMQSMVSEFHRIFKHPCPDKAVGMSDSLAKSRIAFIREELKELEDAVECAGYRNFNEQDGDVEIIDALCDILYFTFGTAVCMGIDIQPFFEEVHRSNMSKLWNNVELQSGEYKIINDTTDGGITNELVMSDESIKLFSVKRCKDGKTVKSPHFSSPKIYAILKQLRANS